MRVFAGEFAKLWRTGPFVWFVLGALVVNGLLLAIGPDAEYPRFLAAHAGADEMRGDPELAVRLAADIEGLTNTFADFDPEAVGRAYHRSLGYEGVVASLMAEKYRRAVPIVAERAAAERALDPYFASASDEVHGYLFGTVLGAVTLEAFVLAFAAGLHVHAVERSGGPGQVVFATRRGRRLLKAKLAAVLATVAGCHAVLAVMASALATLWYGLPGVWTDSVGSGFHHLSDVVVGARPFFTWLDLGVGEYLLLSVLVAVGLSLVVALFAFTVGALVSHAYLAFGVLLLGAGVLLVVPLWGGVSLVGMASVLNPVWLWLKQPVWFTDGGLDTLVPHFETVGAVAWLGVGAVAVLVGYRHFLKGDLR